MGQVIAANLRMGFSSQSIYRAWDMRVRSMADQMSKSVLNSRKHISSNSTSIVTFSILVTIVVNTLPRFGYTSNLESEGGL